MVSLVAKVHFEKNVFVNIFVLLTFQSDANETRTFSGGQGSVLHLNENKVCNSYFNFHIKKNISPESVQLQISDGVRMR